MLGRVVERGVPDELAFTGPAHAVPLALTGLSLFGAGTLLQLAGARGRRRAQRNRPVEHGANVRPAVTASERGRRHASKTARAVAVVLVALALWSALTGPRRR